MHDATILELDRKGLREFGLTTGSIFAALFGLFFPWLLNISFPLWPWIVFGVLGIWALIAPGTLKPIYHWWMKFGLLLSRITTPIILGVVFFLLLAPVALVMRIVGHDPMARKVESDIKSYRIASKKMPKENMEKPF